MRIDLLEKYPDMTLRHQEARALVELHVLGKIRYGSEGARFIASLRRAGVEKSAVADALALAWLTAANEFTVPLASRWHFWRQTWVLLLISFLVAQAVLVGGVFWLRRVNPSLELYFLALPPLIGVIGYAIVIGAYSFLRRATPRQSDASQQARGRH